MNSHVALTKVFDALERVVAQPLSLSSFNYARTEDSSEPTISVSGNADSFNQILFQQEVFSNDPITDMLQIESISYSSQPIDPANPSFGSDDMVNVTFKTSLPATAINFDGRTGAQTSIRPAVTETVVTEDPTDTTDVTDVTADDVTATDETAVDQTTTNDVNQ